MLKQCLDTTGILQYITATINLSLRSGYVPTTLKSALVTPLLKKSSLDINTLKNYRPVSNLPFLSKVMEKVVATQLNDYLTTNSLLEPLQSAYRQYHSTETALLKVHNDICLSLDSGKSVILVLLDLSAAFDTIDHTILLNRLSDLGITAVVHKWFESYLTDRHQSVTIENVTSKPHLLQFGVPQGSVLGPLLFTIYISPLGKLIRQHNLEFHQYTDDNQLYLAFSHNDSLSAVSSIETCICDIKHWMTQNMLQLNDSKTEVIVIRSKFDQSQNLINQITIGSSVITPVKAARNIGVIFDNTHMFHKHIKTTCQSIYAHLRRIGSIRKYLSKETCQILIHATLSSKLDYCNSLLYGLPSSNIGLLQRAQNTAARIVTRSRRTDHISPVLRSLHWLPVQYRLDYKILLLTYKALNGLTPVYIQDLIKPYKPRRSLRSDSKNLLYVPNSRRKTYGGCAFSVTAPKLWNALPTGIRQAQSVTTF